MWHKQKAPAHITVQQQARIHAAVKSMPRPTRVRLTYAALEVILAGNPTTTGTGSQSQAGRMLLAKAVPPHTSHSSRTPRCCCHTSPWRRHYDDGDCTRHGCAHGRQHPAQSQPPRPFPLDHCHPHTPFTISPYLPHHRLCGNDAPGRGPAHARAEPEALHLQSMAPLSTAVALPAADAAVRAAGYRHGRQTTPPRGAQLGTTKRSWRLLRHKRATQMC